ncbi:MAG TPA: acylphosphatase [Gammaproteobacteria bacterium]|nr:acylphosphatase [Gammaproteobacteria bacterium]
MTKIGRRCFVAGVVQGVFYRHGTKEQADSLGLTGWVKNLDDGRVEALLFGEEDQVVTMLEWLAVGPDRAVVTSLEVFEADLEPATSFEIVRD